MDLTALKKMLFKDWLAKLISVIVAIILWIYVNYEKLPIKYRNNNGNNKIEANFKTSSITNVKIVVKNLPENLRVINTNDLFAIATVHGSDESLDKLMETKDFLFVDLNGIIQPGQVKLLIRSKIPGNCKVMNINPEEVIVDVGKQ